MATLLELIRFARTNPVVKEVDRHPSLSLYLRASLSPAVPKLKCRADTDA